MSTKGLDVSDFLRQEASQRIGDALARLTTENLDPESFQNEIAKIQEEYRGKLPRKVLAQMQRTIVIASVAFCKDSPEEK
ncbi:MAG: hypothetical protein Q8N68_00205 [bacterium]|nr:hypothetical protein [bacterium]